MSLFKGTHPSLSIRNSEGKSCIELGLASGDRPNLLIRDKNAKVRTQSFLSLDGSPRFFMFDEFGGVVFEAPTAQK